MCLLESGQTRISIAWEIHEKTNKKDMDAIAELDNSQPNKIGQTQSQTSKERHRLVVVREGW